jgi:hypothetical protein
MADTPPTPPIVDDLLTAAWRAAYAAAVAHLLASRFSACGCTPTEARCTEGQALVEIADDAAERLAQAPRGTVYSEPLEFHGCSPTSARACEPGALVRCSVCRLFWAPCTQTPLTGEEASTGRWLCPLCTKDGGAA